MQTFREISENYFLTYHIHKNKKIDHAKTQKEEDKLATIYKNRLKIVNSILLQLFDKDAWISEFNSKNEELWNLMEEQIYNYPKNRFGFFLMVYYATHPELGQDTVQLKEMIKYYIDNMDTNVGWRTQRDIIRAINSIAPIEKIVDEDFDLHQKYMYTVLDHFSGNEIYDACSSVRLMKQEELDHYANEEKEKVYSK